MSATERVTAWLSVFEKALNRGDIEKALVMFDETSFWRDLVFFTWNIKTAEGRDEIGDMLKATLPVVGATTWTVEGEATGDAAMTEAWLVFESETARGRGHLRLKDGKAWTLLTTMVELKGHEEKKAEARAKGVVHGAFKDRLTWTDQRAREEKELGSRVQPYCLIIGGGQGGIGLGARLRRLGVPTIIIEKNKRAGDSWRKRYKSLCLHDPVWYDHMPYLPFPDDWPIFSPKDKLGDWLEMYTKVMELNYWGSTECKSAKYDEKKKHWVVKVLRAGKSITLKPTQLIIATGQSGVPNIPKFKGAGTFKGEQHHSSKHPGPDKYKGKKVVIIGSNNSAHDISAALWEQGADVTMVQRSSTHIVKSDTLMDIGLGDLYSEKAMKNGIDHHKADLIFASVPYRILHSFQIPAYAKMKERDADFYERLEKAGFWLDWGDDDSGLFMKYLRRGSGYYIFA